MKALVIVVAFATSGCAAIGWTFSKQTRTYRYARPVTVEVRSEPEGAQIIDETGAVVGTAPMTLRTTHQVERTHTQRRRSAVALGCLADAAVGGFGLYKWIDGATFTIDDGSPFLRYETDFFTSNKQRFFLLSFSFSFVDCFAGITNIALTNGKEKRERDTLQVQPRPYDKVSTSEVVIPREITVQAKWADWLPVGGKLTVPTQSLLVLRRGHAGTFDDAIVRRSRAGAQLGPDGLYRAGLAYLTMTRETKDPAHAKLARTHFEAYLATPDIPDARRAEVARALAELKAATDAR